MVFIDGWVWGRGGIGGGSFLGFSLLFFFLWYGGVKNGMDV